MLIISTHLSFQGCLSHYPVSHRLRDTGSRLPRDCSTFLHKVMVEMKRARFAISILFRYIFLVLSILSFVSSICHWQCMEFSYPVSSWKSEYLLSGDVLSLHGRHDNCDLGSSISGQCIATCIGSILGVKTLLASVPFFWSLPFCSGTALCLAYRRVAVPMAALDWGFTPDLL